MSPLIDLHCHILPGLDDGAGDLDDSAAMARQAADDGIEAVCATPHIRHDHDVRIHELEGRVAELAADLERRDIPLALLAGGEVAETIAEDLGDEELGRVSLGGGPWILLEPAPGPLSDSLERRVEHLAQRGHRSLIAHPERHVAHDLAERLARLVHAGALVQATADFFLHPDSGPGMLSLAERGLVHVLGSDAHSSRYGRPVRLAAAFEVLSGVGRLASHLDWMARDGPRAIVEGRDLEPPFEPA